VHGAMHRVDEQVADDDRLRRNCQGLTSGERLML
jgi:hypothetical protein